MAIVMAIGLLMLATLTQAQTGPVLETVAVLDDPPGNITVAPDGTVLVSVHPSLTPRYVALAIHQGEVHAFPTGAWSTVLHQEARAGQAGMLPVLGIRAGADGLVWMLSGFAGQSVKHLYAWDMNNDQLRHDFQFSAPPAVAQGSFFNDLALAPRHNAIFISDPAAGNNAAIVVVNMSTGEGRRRLEGHASVRAEAVTAYIDGKVLGTPGPDGETLPLRGDVNPITIDAAQQWLYYGAMSGRSVYRVRVADLLDDALSPAELGARVERYADKAISAGITMDDDGNVYVADIQANGIGLATPEAYRVIVQDPLRLSWPDGISVGPDGYVYTGSNSLFRSFASHSGEGGPKPPFYITRFKALGPTTSGR
ncbi:MAG: L-dopachrome tautomerase-related protein [Pseudomonadales bacterium]|nr:L-dopachrome tautomerase-related protein [Pseudomonadales bacterium]